MNNKNNTEIEYSGNNILSQLQLIFLVLKMAGLVNWSWWFVFAPGIVNVIIAIILTIIIIYIDRK